MTSHTADTLLVDVDGTLVDSTYHHALAWHRAFAAHDVSVPVWRVHSAIGMGGDRLVSVVAGSEVEHRLGDTLRGQWEHEYARLRSEVRAFDGVGRFLKTMHERSWRVAVASSGTPENTRAALDLVDADNSIDAVTTSEDVDESKPAGDILRAALRAAGGRRGLALGDSPYDVEAAAEIGAECIAVRTGGFSKGELSDAGAVLVVDAVADLLEHLDAQLLQTPAQ